ncbi:MAG: tRNA (guanosine(18)-2'-O)-methyltransferase TrmH [Ectothiorhodospiraceae bacterium]|nr:tRNA (guanosine(18)-2'-O)-methyltransferase TrmH [Chromatiales bacterium]MCP5153840.1 tRNA (guanosine(18)-2'-O)-methyltransferase TrmH [Ectothiorhodospiraceae bacterium]
MTPQRLARLQAVLDRRQPDLTLLLDNVHKPHNLAAVVRTADAVGIQDVHAVWPVARLRPRHDASGGVGKWITTHPHASIGDAVAALRAGGHSLVAADLTPAAVDFRSVDYTRPTALVLGAERDGVSPAARAAVDTFVTIPMMGMVESFNVSVAAAIILGEAQRQRAAAGLYDRPRLDAERRRVLLFEWAHPAVAAYCRKHGLPYPPLDADGEIADPEWRDRA